MPTTPARRIANLVQVAQAICRRDLPAHELLDDLLARAATEALAAARVAERSHRSIASGNPRSPQMGFADLEPDRPKP